MRRLAFLILAMFATGMTVFAMNDRPEPYDLPYYKAHPAVREMMLNVCNKNAAKQRSTDCENAEAASIAGIPAVTDKPLAYMYDPKYWHDNPFARDLVIAECDAGPPADDIMHPFCDAARQGR